MTREIYNLFDSLTPETIPWQCPAAGTKYLYKWENDNAKDDWRADGYRWRQNGPQRQRKCEEGVMYNLMFYVSNVTVLIDTYNQQTQTTVKQLTWAALR